MRIALVLAAGAVVGVAGWAATSSGSVSAETMCASVDEARTAEEVAQTPEGLLRPDVLAAPPPRYRRVESAVGAMAVVAVAAPGLTDLGSASPESDAWPEEGVWGSEGVETTRSAEPSVSGQQAVERDSSSVAAIERRGYDGSRCPEFNFDDRATDLFDVEVAQDAFIPDPGPGRDSRIWSPGRTPALRVIERLPDWVPRSTIAFEGTRDDFDALERAFDERTFSGGRDVTLDVVRLGDPATCLADFGLLPPAAGANLSISLATAEAVVRRARGSSSVTLDVPEDRAAFGFAGQACTYVADYDVEISQAASIAGPIYRVAEAGLGVSARVSGGSDGSIEMILDARWASRLPEFTTFSTSLATGPVTSSPPVVIEIPKANEPVSEFHGRVSMGVGDGALVGLTSGAVLVVVPRSAVRDTTHVRTWRPVSVTEPPTAGPARPPESETIEVEWTRIDAAPTNAARGSARFEHVGESGVVGSPTKPGADDDSLRSLGVPGSVYLVPGPVLDRRRIDVVVRPSRPLEPGSRPFSVLGRPDPVDLPRVSRVVIPLRFLLRDGETGVRDVTIDRGEGPEAWRVTVSRYGVR